MWQTYRNSCTSCAPVCYICRMSTQRTIKFRAWHSREEEMTAWDIIFDDGILPYFRDDAFILMQYTGLKDKDGREIYEGDVLRGYMSNDFDNTRTQVVQYATNGFAMGGGKAPDGSSQTIGFNIHLDEYIVIGNIYENHELIEA